MNLKNLSIGKKIYALAALIIIIFTPCIIWLVSNLSNAMHETAEKRILSAVETSWGIIDHYSKMVGPDMTLEQAQELAKETVRGLRFDNGEIYFWINDTHPNIIMHPIKPKLEGQDASGIKDPDGLALFVEFAKATAKTGSAFVTYQWPKPGKEQPQPKLSYVKKHPKWNWIIGSGLYIDDIQSAINKIIYTSIAVILLVILGSAATVFYVARMISGPTQKAVTMMEELEMGHLSERLDLSQNDEIGKMARSMDAFADSLQNEVIASIQKLANGDLDLNVVAKDERDEVRGALTKLENDLNNVMASIQTAGDQISAGSTNVSDSAQALSQGATESAASLEEISSSLNQMSSQTQQSADNANQVNMLSTEAKQATENGQAMMQRMVAAMDDISLAGQNINKIIKVIDEIAFQTNLLALNAAVEAARAGQHGKGFAVVAEEVRNLAARSAKAASETAELIEGSVQKTENGAEIAGQTATALESIYGSVSKVSDLAEEIATASKEQAEGIGQINEGLGQIDAVIQQNTATAEESASSAEELSSQAAELLNMLKRFRLKNRNERPSSQQMSPSMTHVAPKTTKPTSTTGKGGWGAADKASNVIALDDKEFGKF